MAEWGNGATETANGVTRYWSNGGNERMKMVQMSKQLSFPVRAFFHTIGSLSPTHLPRSPLTPSGPFIDPLSRYPLIPFKTKPTFEGLSPKRRMKYGNHWRPKGMYTRTR